MEQSVRERDYEATRNNFTKVIYFDENLEEVEATGVDLPCNKLSVQPLCSGSATWIEQQKESKTKHDVSAIQNPSRSLVAVAKKAIFMRAKKKSLRGSILCSGVVGRSAPEIQAFLMDKIVVVPAIPLLRIFFGFFNETQHPQTVFRKPIQSVTDVIKQAVTAYIPSASDKSVNLPRKASDVLQYGLEMMKDLAKG